MRIIIIVAAGIGLAGCSSMSMPSFSGFKPEPPTSTVQFESLPVGAEAKTSTGQSCKTPCSMAVPAQDGFSVTFSAPKYQSETVPVLVIRQQADIGVGGDTQGNPSPQNIIDPNPVYAELKPGGPQKGAPKAAAKSAKPPKAKKPKPSVAPAADDASPFPPPPGR